MRLGEKRYADDSELEPASEEDEADPGAERELFAANGGSPTDAPCLTRHAEE